MVRLTFSGNKITSDINIDTNYHERTLKQKHNSQLKKNKSHNQICK